MTEKITATTPPRKRGRPARVSRDSIIAVARGIEHDQLSMQSVADKLGVDRSTINYHFSDRDELFSAVASSMFGQRFRGYAPPASPDWRLWVRSYANAVYEALINQPEFTSYVKLTLGSDSSAFTPVESLMEKLAESGFSTSDVAQMVAYISEVVHAAARNRVLVKSGGHPQEFELRKFLSEQAVESVPGIRRLIDLDPLGNQEHFEFVLAMLIAGFESLPRN